MKTIVSILTAFMLLLGVASASAQTTADAAYKEALETMLEKSNSRQVILESLTATYSQMGLTEANAKAASEEIVAIMWPKMLDFYAAEYPKYFSLDDVKALIKFYETPVGEKMAKYNALLAQEAQKSVLSDHAFMAQMQGIIMKYMQ